MPFPQRVVPSREDIPDVFQGNSQNVLQKAAVNNMIGLLEQLNKISTFASEIFSEILSTTEKNSTRIKRVRNRLNSLESSIEPSENIFVNNSPAYFYDNPYTGKEWQRKDPLRGLLFRRDRANKAVNIRRSVGLPLPDLSSLDRISVNGQCIKKYSDSNFFMNEWLEAEKKKMEEEKAKRRERKKKRKKRKRQQKEKITGIERWVYDPVTGKKIKKKATEITVTKYELTDTNIAGNIDFESADSGAGRERMPTFNTSKVAQMANKKEKKSKRKKQIVSNLAANREHQAGGPSYGEAAAIKQAAAAAAGNRPPPVPFAGGNRPPPVPVAAKQPNMDNGPPPVPFAANNNNRAAGGPPPVPNIRGGPPPVPAVAVVKEKKKLTGAEMAALSASRAAASGAYQAPVKKVEERKVAPLVPVSSNALLDGIRGGVKLKKTTQVKREPKQDKRDMLLSALKNKGQSGLKKVVIEERKEEEKQVDNTIFAILNRRQFMADSSESETGSEWSSED